MMGTTFINLLNIFIVAFLEDDPSIAAVDTVSFYTISKPLMVSVDGAEYMVFSVDQEIVLDAGISQDPDRQNLPAFYSWTCIHVRIVYILLCLPFERRETLF